jgi:HD-GYP domain-containing protein (c-di-GMP phosphodiesterase class II)/anti-anti-sigma regulatory factor
MATRLEPLKLAHPALFGVRVVGTVGPADRDRLRELTDRCLDRGKLRLVLDLSGMNAVGGGGARTLAAFQESLVAAGGEAVFCGASDLVAHFLEQKFDGLPLRLFADVAEAEEACGREAEAGTAPDADTELSAVGAVAFADDENEQPAEATQAPQAEPADAPGGRRKDHHYMSLSDAVASLGRWTDHDDKAAFARALGNLLFSHGLAEHTVLLVRRGNRMIEAAGDRWVDADGGFVRAVSASPRPLTLLDIAADALDEQDTTVLAAADPDVILPVSIDGVLAAMVLLRREGDEREYSVAENFALELLMRVLTAREETAPAAEAPRGDEPAGQGGRREPEWIPDGTTAAEVLLQLALDLPEAVDRPHFWRIFARHSWPVLPVSQLGFLAADRTRPQIMIGGNDSWMGLDLGADRLQLFFSTMERPVAVANMPGFFKAVRQEMQQAGVEWIVALKWDGEHLGTVLLEMHPDFNCDDATGLLEELFTETSRLLHRYDGSNDNADVNLELVRILVSLRERQCFGTDANAAAMVAHISRLARVMAFPPDQERDLMYGCLLRDVGLFDKDEQAAVAGPDAPPELRERYRRHPDEGAALLAGLNLPATIMDVVRCHHERFDGRGFPRGLKGRSIPLAARVVAVVDHYTALVTGTMGRAVLKPEAAALVMRELSGTDFDPELVEMFLSAVLPSARRRPEVPERELVPVG